jgi:hypothetical protein
LGDARDQLTCSGCWRSRSAWIRRRRASWMAPQPLAAFERGFDRAYLTYTMTR